MKKPRPLFRPRQRHRNRYLERGPEGRAPVSYSITIVAKFFEEPFLSDKEVQP
jgi:hypothetical protein